MYLCILCLAYLNGCLNDCISVTMQSLSRIMDASMEDLARCPGIGERKVIFYHFLPCILTVGGASMFFYMAFLYLYAYFFEWHFISTGTGTTTIITITIINIISTTTTTRLFCTCMHIFLNDLLLVLVLLLLLLLLLLIIILGREESVAARRRRSHTILWFLCVTTD